MTATAKTINMTTPRCDITENVDARDAPADDEEEEGEWRNDVGWKCQKCDEWFEYCEVKESAEWGTICHECDEAPKPVVLCADCGDAIPDTENLDKCWTNDGETFWCEGCRESHVEEYIRERDGDDEEEVSECVKIREDGLGCNCAVCFGKNVGKWDGSCCWVGVGEQKPANHPYP